MQTQLNIAPSHPDSHVFSSLMLDFNALERWTGPRAENLVVPFDSLQYPNWYAQKKHWHPWIPHKQDGLWWHQIMPDSTFLPLDDEARAKEDLLGMVKILGVDVELMQAWRLDQPGGLGVILDLTRDKREMNIGLYLQYNILVYYPWTLSAAADGAFYHLSPSYLLSLDNYQEAFSIPPMNFDFFFQPMLPGQRGLAMMAQELPPLTHQVLDFQGWIPRSISGKAARCCLQLFYFEERIVDVGVARSYLRIYHRFRPNVTLNPAHLTLNSSDVCIRERWKFNHAPHAGQFYDTATQQLKTAEPTPMQVPLPINPSWGLMVPPLAHIHTGCQVPAQSEVGDLADSDPEQFLQEIIVQVDFATHSGLDSQIQNFVLRFPNHLSVPYNGDDHLSLGLNCMEKFSASRTKFMITLTEGMN
ncbi:hypothetical protein BDR06DRAFT_967402 [Suillus hirtellus]|nr:hypothetical protein BDR06DRAFT_969405 [Suillus hirtellus]KAG2059827.1 hypothetical protein BDR06DRAFT_967402 [Suillus hirtellus]